VADHQGGELQGGMGNLAGAEVAMSDRNPSFGSLARGPAIQQRHFQSRDFLQ
jgi:hypothetical protein